MVNRFVLQWHISEACNLKCRHCYQEDRPPVQLPPAQLRSILDQYRELLNRLGVKGHINLTGGEPLCSPLFYPMLDEFRKDAQLYSFSVLTNGTLITDEAARKISEYRPAYVQVSLEGGKKTNDLIRGEGVWNKVAEAIGHLKKYRIFVSLSFTATKLNYKEFPKVVRFAEKHGVDNVWSDRYIPLNPAADGELPMNQEETNAFLQIMADERRRLQRKRSRTNVAMYRALQFQMTNDLPYTCTAGRSLLTVMENGDLVPCRRMPVVVGNLLETGMYELYVNSPFLQRLREETIPDECRKCEHARLCAGGLKCLTYATYRDLNRKDVGCTWG